MATYQITLSEKQLSIIERALELYARIHMGQLDEVRFELRLHELSTGVNDWAKWDEIRALLDKASERFTNLGGGYFGILSEKVSNKAKVAWDLYQDIRYRLAWDNNPDGGYNVRLSDPLLVRASATEKPAEVKRKQED